MNRPILRIPYSRQVIEADDIEAVTQALTSRMITQGPLVEEFENTVAQRCGARYAIAFSNGTAALHAAVMAAGIGEGDEGLVPAISFVATANCLVYAGAKPRFTDVQDTIPQMDPKSLERHMTRDTRVIIPVHFSGVPAPMKEIRDIADKARIPVIEDACHALGARYKDGNEWIPVGSCRHSEMTVFSFHPVKNITTGEGGMVTTNDPGLMKRLEAFRQHGIQLPPADAGYPAWYYEMQTLGYNFRLTEMQGALGLSQVKKLDRFLSAREEKFKYYREHLKNMPGIHLLEAPENTQSALHLALICVEDFTGRSYTRDELFNYLRDHDVGCQLHYIPIYRHPYYRKNFPTDVRDYPRSENYFTKALSIPLYPTLTQSEQDEVIHHIREWNSIRLKAA